MFILAFIIYIVGVVIFLSFAGIIVYHLRRYGFIGDATVPMTGIFLLVSAVIIVFSAIGLFRTDWDELDLIDTSIFSSSSDEQTEDGPSIPLRNGDEQ